MSLPVIALYIYPDINPFNFSVPQMIFNISISDKKIFDLKIFSIDGKPVKTEHSMTIIPDGGLELIAASDIIIIPGWVNLSQKPEDTLIKELNDAYKKHTKLVGLCYGTYALAYAGLLKGKKAATHWLAEHDFSERFPDIKLDKDALYVEDQGIITSAGTGAALDCCLYLVREIYDSQIANKVSRVMVIPPHREGGQAQFIEQPIANSCQDAEINFLLDYLRKNIAQQHTVDSLASRTNMTRRTFTRHFKKATGMTLVQWLNIERIRYSSELLETTKLSIEKIAEYSGFNNTVLFRKNFRAKYNTSPRSWRKSFGINNTN